MAFTRSLTVLFIVASMVAYISGQTNSTDIEESTTKSDSDGHNIISEEMLLGVENIEKTVREILTQLRNNSAVKVPGMDIPDPMPFDDLDISVAEGLTTADVQMWNVTIEGLSAFTVDHVVAHLTSMQVGIGMNFTTLTTKGGYNLKGRFSFFRLSGNGNFSMAIKEAYVSGIIFLGVTREGHVAVDDMQLDITVESIKLHFENLGGGAMSKFMNTFINALSNVIFNTLKPTILEQLHVTVKAMLNEQFSNMPPEPLLGLAQSPLDLMLANTATQMRNNKLDPFKLPDYNKSFYRRVFFVNVYGNLSLYDGYLKGLSTLHRTGEITMAFNGNVLQVSAEMGFWKLEGGYKWKGTFMGVTKQGGVHFFVKGVSLLFNATQNNTKGAHPELTALEIKSTDQVGLDVDGLGSFDFLLEFFSNFFSNVLKKQFSRITESQLKKNIQKNLNDIQMPF